MKYLIFLALMVFTNSIFAQMPPTQSVPDQNEGEDFTPQTLYLCRKLSVRVNAVPLENLMLQCFWQVYGKEAYKQLAIIVPQADIMVLWQNPENQRIAAVNLYVAVVGRRPVGTLQSFLTELGQILGVAPLSSNSQAILVQYIELIHGSLHLGLSDLLKPELDNLYSSVFADKAAQKTLLITIYRQIFGADYEKYWRKASMPIDNQMKQLCLLAGESPQMRRAMTVVLVFAILHAHEGGINNACNKLDIDPADMLRLLKTDDEKLRQFVIYVIVLCRTKSKNSDFYFTSMGSEDNSSIFEDSFYSLFYSGIGVSGLDKILTRIRPQVVLIVYIMVYDDAGERMHRRSQEKRPNSPAMYFWQENSLIMPLMIVRRHKESKQSDVWMQFAPVRKNTQQPSAMEQRFFELYGVSPRYIPKGNRNQLRFFTGLDPQLFLAEKSEKWQLQPAYRMQTDAPLYFVDHDQLTGDYSVVAAESDASYIYRFRDYHSIELVFGNGNANKFLFGSCPCKKNFYYSIPGEIRPEVKKGQVVVCRSTSDTQQRIVCYHRPAQASSISGSIPLEQSARLLIDGVNQQIRVREIALAFCAQGDLVIEKALPPSDFLRLQSISLSPVGSAFQLIDKGKYYYILQSQYGNRAKAYACVAPITDKKQLLYLGLGKKTKDIGRHSLWLEW